MTQKLNSGFLGEISISLDRRLYFSRAEDQHFETVLTNEWNKPVGQVRWDVTLRLSMAQWPCIWRDDAWLVNQSS